MEEIRRFYYSDEGQEIYFQRGHFAESSFAILLESRNFRGIKTKGLKKANDELTISEIHHNIKKLEKHTTNKFLKLILLLFLNKNKLSITCFLLNNYQKTFSNKKNILRI